MSNGDIVPERGEDGKSSLKRWFTPLSFILIALISFGLGRLSVKTIPEPVKILNVQDAQEQKATVLNTVAPQATLPQESLVASKNGKKYYPLSCAGANRIKEENKIYFNTQTEAESAGFSKAANCK